jgi:hypothetical protein
VAARICPHCTTEILALEVAARSNDVECPKCNARLEVASSPRTISSICGLAAGAIAWRLASNSTGDLSGVLPTLYAFLAFGIVSPIVLMLTANLRNAPEIVILEVVQSSGASHGTVGHDGAHH